MTAGAQRRKELWVLRAERCGAASAATASSATPFDSRAALIGKVAARAIADSDQALAQVNLNGDPREVLGRRVAKAVNSGVSSAAATRLEAAETPAAAPNSWNVLSAPDATPASCGCTAVGLVRRRIRPLWALPLQSLAMLALAAIALLALQVDATTGALLVASALLGHACWDLHHHRTGRVVSRSFAEFCGVLDVLVATVVAAATLAS